MSDCNSKRGRLDYNFKVIQFCLFIIKIHSIKEPHWNVKVRSPASLQPTRARAVAHVDGRVGPPAAGWLIQITRASVGCGGARTGARMVRALSLALSTLERAVDRERCGAPGAAIDRLVCSGVAGAPN